MNVIRFNWLLNRYKYDREAVQELYECYYPWIVRYINWQFRGAMDGRDIAQQFFLKLFNCKTNPIRAPNAWVRTVARNLAIDVLRKSGNRQKAEEFAAMSERVDLPENVSEELTCLNETEKKIVHYFSVNSGEPAKPAGTNWNNDGATGQDAIAIGKNAVSDRQESTAIGSQ